MQWKYWGHYLKLSAKSLLLTNFTNDFLRGRALGLPLRHWCWNSNWSTSFYVTIRSPSAITKSVKVIVRWIEIRTIADLLQWARYTQYVDERYKSFHQQNSLHEGKDYFRVIFKAPTPNYKGGCVATASPRIPGADYKRRGTQALMSCWKSPWQPGPEHITLLS